jgi:hypothetical protein
MSVPVPPPPGATPVQGWGVATLDPARRYAEVVRIAAGETLALGSLTFSDATSPEPNKAAILQLETAVAGNAGAPGPVLTQFFQLEVVSGGSFHMPFPVPLILEGRPDQETVFRFLIVGETPGLAFAEIGCLAVGFTF